MGGWGTGGKSSKGLNKFSTTFPSIVTVSDLPDESFKVFHTIHIQQEWLNNTDVSLRFTIHLITKEQTIYSLVSMGLEYVGYPMLIVRYDNSGTHNWEPLSMCYCSVRVQSPATLGIGCRAKLIILGNLFYCFNLINSIA